MDLKVCSNDLIEKGYCVIHCGRGAKAQQLEKVCRDVMEYIKAGTGGEYNCSGGVSRAKLDCSNLLDTREGAPPELTIQFHNEMAYAAKFPKYIAFAMVRRDPEGTGGHTILCDNVKLIDILSESLIQKMKGLGVMYIRKLEDISYRFEPFFYNSWQEAFGTKDRTEAIKRGNSSETSFLFEDKDGKGHESMSHNTWCPLFYASHQFSGEVLFSSILNRHGSWLSDHAYFGTIPFKERPYHCKWGDGSEFSDEELKEIRHAHDLSTIELILNEGDVVVIDNLRVKHGRTPYTGERALGLFLSDMISRSYHRPCEAFLEMKRRLGFPLYSN